MDSQLILWLVFGFVVVAALSIDLGIFQRRAHVVRPKEALVWSLVWIGLALLFNAGVVAALGAEEAGEFLAGYLIEKSLSVDNLFVFLVIFSSFAIPKQYEARILIWGIVGAVLLRAAFVFGGAALLQRFHWLIYVFGAFLIVTGLRMLVKHGESDPKRNPLVRLFRRTFPFTDQLHGQKFFARVDGRLLATPLFLVLLVVETTDVIFAVDSIPAIFAVTTDPFIVFTSNVFAILGLRSLYFLLAAASDLFRYLKHGLVLILWFVGAKMVLADVVKIPVVYSLATIGTILAGSMAASVLASKRERAPAPPEPTRADPSPPRHEHP
jgi:tellurite resistance protein TerC